MPIKKVVFPKKVSLKRFRIRLGAPMCPISVITCSAPLHVPAKLPGKVDLRPHCLKVGGSGTIGQLHRQRSGRRTGVSGKKR